MAVDSLDAAAKRLQAALPLLTKLVSSSPHVPEHHTLENFRQTLKAAHDVSIRPSTWSPSADDCLSALSVKF